MKTEAVQDVSLMEALEDYRRRTMLEHLLGPVISVVLHLGVLVVALVFMTGPVETPESDTKINMRDIWVKQIEAMPELKPIEMQNPMPDLKPTMEGPEAAQGGDQADGGYGSVADFNDSIASTSDGGMVDSVCDVKLSSGVVTIPGVYKGRDNGGKRGMPPGNGTRGLRPPWMVDVDPKLNKALQWLKDHQNPDGSWSNAYPVAMSGLALLTYLGCGELGNSPRYGTTVQRAIVYLSNRLNETADGAMVEPHSRGYGHAIATYAIAEAYGMTKNPALRPVMEKGLAVIVSGQQDGGGWDYGYAKNERWDLSLSGWQVQALKAGFISGSNNSQLKDALQKAMGFLAKTANSGGSFRYSNGETALRPNMQGVGALCLQMLGDRDAPEVKAATRWIKENAKVVWNDNKRDQSDLVVNFAPYGWYYGTYAMLFVGGGSWMEWQKQSTQEICRNQESDGHWNAPPARGGVRATVTQGNDIEPYYATTLCCLVLEADRRLLPSANPDLSGNHSDGPSSITDFLGGAK